MTDWPMMDLDGVLDDTARCLDAALELCDDPEGFEAGDKVPAWLAKLRWLRTELVKVQASLPTIESAGLTDELRTEEEAERDVRDIWDAQMH